MDAPNCAGASETEVERWINDNAESSRMSTLCMSDEFCVGGTGWLVGPGAAHLFIMAKKCCFKKLLFWLHVLVCVVFVMYIM